MATRVRSARRRHIHPCVLLSIYKEATSLLSIFPFCHTASPALCLLTTEKQQSKSNHGRRKLSHSQQLRPRPRRLHWSWLPLGTFSRSSCFQLQLIFRTSRRDLPLEIDVAAASCWRSKEEGSDPLPSALCYSRAAKIKQGCSDLQLHSARYVSATFFSSIGLR